MAWWFLSDEEIEKDPVARQERQLSYYNTFYASEDGRCVLNDIREMCFSSGNIDLISLYLAIRNRAGRTRETEKAMIDAEAQAIMFESAGSEKFAAVRRNGKEEQKNILEVT